jgi:aryl-alcohol dehydrogenase-like predicted oxidoreductase
MKFILGTATFGSTYGVANNGKQLDEKSAFEILEKAMQLGIETIDTSPDYANAEEIIGKYHCRHDKFKIHSKISANTPLELDSIIAKLELSLERLKVDKLEVAYFHNPDSLFLLQQKEINKLIEKILESGLVESVGASVYLEGQIDKIAQEFPSIRVFQVPENILDQRLLKSKLIQNLKQSGHIFFVRSVFLQGLLLMNLENLPPKLKSAKDGLNEFLECASKLNYSPLEACLGYLLNIDWANGFLVGVSDVNQLQDLLLSSEKKFPIEGLPKPLNTDLIDPRNWSQV